MCAWYEHVWARPHVIHKVRAVFGIPMDMKACITNNVFWTQATDSRQLVPVFHNLKCHHFNAKTYKDSVFLLPDKEKKPWTQFWDNGHWYGTCYNHTIGLQTCLNY